MSRHATFTCHACGYTQAVEAVHAGKVFPCPKCRTHAKVMPPEGAKGASALPPPPGQLSNVAARAADAGSKLKTAASSAAAKAAPEINKAAAKAAEAGTKIKSAASEAAAKAAPEIGKAAEKAAEAGSRLKNAASGFFSSAGKGAPPAGTAAEAPAEAPAEARSASAKPVPPPQAAASFGAPAKPGPGGGAILAKAVLALGSVVLFVILYILFMIPTYLLPMLGSNSAVGMAAAATVAVTPQLLAHFVCLLVLLVLTLLRGLAVGRVWMIIFPILVFVFEFVPVLNWIPLVPTLLHIATIVIGVIPGKSAGA